MTGGEPAGGRRAGGGTADPQRVGWPAAAAGVGSGVAGAPGVGAGVGTGVWTGAWAGAGAAGTTDRSWGAGGGSGAGLAGLVRAGIVGPGTLDGAAGGGSLPGGVWAPAGMASHVDTAAARRMRELSMRQLCVPCARRGPTS